jgi:hypothetical protein
LRHKKAQKAQEIILCFLCLFVAKKKSVAWTIMEPVILVPATLETQGSSPSLDINPVCMKKVSSYNVCILLLRNFCFFQFVVTFISYLR